MLDQRLLPQKEEWIRLKTAEEVAQAIKDMVIRGAPAIGIAGAMGIAQEAVRALKEGRDIIESVERAQRILGEARPTAVNLKWAVNRMIRKAREKATEKPHILASYLWSEAIGVMEEDINMNKQIGRIGAELIPDKATVMTHCNAGALATGGYGTALGVIRAAIAAGKDIKVVACETRPYLQGARLTAWELMREGIDVTLIVDSAAGSLMARGKVDCVVVGADRIARNGDTANKIGTYTHAVLANQHGIPFYVAAPSSTLDLSLPSGDAIPIEERGSEEVFGFGGIRIAPEGIKSMNPVFDVTPWSLITAIITEKGVHMPEEGGFRFDL